MSRTIDEIRLDLRAAASEGDDTTTLRLADELDSLGTPEACGLASLMRGNVARNANDFHLAVKEYRIALADYRKAGHSAGSAQAANEAGIAYRALGDNPKALEYYHQARTFFEDLADQNGVAHVINNIGVIHHSTGNYPEALEHYHQALTIREEIKDRNGMAMVTGNIGAVHRATGSFPSALDQYRRALTMYEEAGDRAGVASVTGNIGVVLAETQKYDEALEHFAQAKRINEELGKQSSVSRTIGNIGDSLLRSGRIEEARALVAEFLQMDVADPSVQIDRQNLVGRLQELDGDTDAARATYTASLESANEHGLRSSAANAHLLLRDLAESLQDLPSYIRHNNAFTEINEEIKGKKATLNVVMQEKQREISAMERERDKERSVLYSALPKHVADRVIRGEPVTDHFNQASVLFLDIVGFTTISDRIHPEHVVHLLKSIFQVCDNVCTRHGVSKVKTIGDSYMALCTPSAAMEAEGLNHVQVTASAAQDMMESLNELEVMLDPELGDTSWIEEIGEITVRLGIHCGPVVAGVVGTERLQYDVWGDTVNTASRMESTCEAGRIQVSEAFATALRSFGTHTLTERGEIEIKGKGTMRTFWLG